MISAWTKQFLIATGLFALVLTGQTVNIVLKDKNMAHKALAESHRTVRVSSPGQFNIN